MIVICLQYRPLEFDKLDVGKSELAKLFLWFLFSIDKKWWKCQNLLLTNSLVSKMSFLTLWLIFTIIANIFRGGYAAKLCEHNPQEWGGWQVLVGTVLFRPTVGCSSRNPWLAKPAGDNDLKVQAKNLIEIESSIWEYKRNSQKIG